MQQTLTIQEALADFWAIVVRTWDHGFMGIAVHQLIYALLLLGLAALGRHLFSASVLRRLRRWSGHSESEINDAIIAALAPPIRFIPIVLAIFIISEFITDTPRFTAIFAEINRSLVAFTIFWALFRAIEKLHLIVHRRTKNFSLAMIGWATRAGKILVVALGTATILEIWGIQVGAILAGLGLFGVAVALGAQDVFKNLIAGIFIIAEQRFQNGDWVLAENVVEGMVESIGLRTTKVRRFDMAPVFVPNSKLADNAVTNFSQMTYRRISWIVGLEYDTTVDQLRRIRDGIEAYILGNSEFAHPPLAPTFVRVDKFNESSIDLMVYCFTCTTNWAEWLKIKEALTYAIKDIVEGTGSGFAYPSRSLYVETTPAGAEVFPISQQPEVDGAARASAMVG